MALIRDPCRVVQRGVLQSPKLSEREVESFASMTSLTEEILRVIALKRNFPQELYDRKKSCEQFEDADRRFAKSASDDSTHGLENAYSK